MTGDADCSTRTRTCYHCHKEFSYEIGTGRDRKHCSLKCQKDHQRENRKPKHTKAERRKNRAFSEVKRNPPERVKRTLRTKGKEAARKQSVAIALDKARRGKKRR